MKHSSYELFKLNEDKTRSFAISKVLSVVLLFTLLFVIHSAVYYTSANEFDKLVVMYYSGSDKFWLYCISIMMFIYLYNLQERIGNLKNIILQINDLHIRNVLLSKLVQEHLMKRLVYLQILMLTAIVLPIFFHFLSSSFWFSFVSSAVIGLMARWQINEVSKFLSVNAKESGNKYVKINLHHLKYNLAKQYELIESL